MELREYGRILRRWWWAACLPALAILAYTGLTYRTPPTLYQVVLNFAAGTPPEAPADQYGYDRYYAWLASEYIANGLSDIVRRGAFAQAVSRRLAAQGITGADGEPLPAGAIQGAIVSDNAQSLFVVYVTWPDPTQLPALAEAITAEVTENAAAYFPQLADLPVPPARLVDLPVVTPLPPSLRSRLTGPAIRVGLGVALGIGLAFLLHYLDPTVRDRHELEAMGIPVLSAVPKGRGRQ